MHRRTFAAVGTGLLAASLLLARAHPFGDPALYAKPQSPAAVSEIPAEVRAILDAKCADCHSLQTHAPVYGRFAPASWLMERDIVKARQAMNLSAWESYSAEDQNAFKAKIVLETRSGKMPPPQYVAIHWGTRVNDAELATLIRWSRQGAMSSSEPTPAQGDAARGKIVFEKRCTGCHALNGNREGPHLRGAYGRPAGSVADFGYSNVLKNAHIVWDEDTLDRWLTDTDDLFPGNNMDFRVVNPQERADVIEFLKSQH